MARIVGLIAFALPFLSWAEGDFLPAQLGHQKLRLEVVESVEDRARGLMYRSSLPADQGMLFVFEAEQPLTFWMKNTLLPLSIAYLDANLKIVDIQDMNPAPAAIREPPRYPSAKPAQFALEVNQGWFKKHKIGLGARLKILQGPASPRLKRFFKPSGPKSAPHQTGD